ncbi:hypothetical protein [Pseudomonas sp.]|uniref:hypothetical protein n=1 Tax=Pseudomonas sp. TaxID=306 RepID=UPI0032642F16
MTAKPHSLLPLPLQTAKLLVAEFALTEVDSSSGHSGITLHNDWNNIGQRQTDGWALNQSLPIPTFYS